jgi:hypothetical protein
MRCRQGLPGRRAASSGPIRRDWRSCQTPSRRLAQCNVLICLESRGRSPSGTGFRESIHHRHPHPCVGFWGDPRLRRLTAGSPLAHRFDQRRLPQIARCGRGGTQYWPIVRFELLPRLRVDPIISACIIQLRARQVFKFGVLFASDRRVLRGVICHVCTLDGSRSTPAAQGLGGFCANRAKWTQQPGRLSRA